VEPVTARRRAALAAGRLDETGKEAQVSIHTRQICGARPDVGRAGKMTGWRARGDGGPDRLSHGDEAQTGSAGVLMAAGQANETRGRS
jgi:hypothetical protein